MNAYLIAAKANAWEIGQHVGRAIDAGQPAYVMEAVGHGEGCYQKREAPAPPSPVKMVREGFSSRSGNAIEPSE